MEQVIQSNGARLVGHLARPPAGTRPTAALVLCHGFPPDQPGSAAESGASYPEFADRLAAETGLPTLAFNFRGTGRSPGQFSLAGWLDDLAAAIDHVVAVTGVSGVWLVGTSAGGALSICQAARDDRVRGVATLAAPADFGPWAADPEAFLQRCRVAGVIQDPAYPPDVQAWAAEARRIRPVDVIAKIPPRPMLLLHGSDDDVVPVDDGRVLVDAAAGQADLRVVPATDHGLRHDPRVIAILLGWLERQAAAE